MQPENCSHNDKYHMTLASPSSALTKVDSGILEITRRTNLLFASIWSPSLLHVSPFLGQEKFRPLSRSFSDGIVPEKLEGNEDE